MENNKRNFTGSGSALLKKGKKGIAHTIFSRFGFIAAMLLLQIGFIIWALVRFENSFSQIYGISYVLALVMVLFLLNSNSDPTAKITWLIIIAVIPVFGALLYLYTQSDIGHRALKDRTNQIKRQTSALIIQNEETRNMIDSETRAIAALARYVKRCGCYPIYNDTDVKYFSSGSEKFSEMLIQLEKAEKYIFLEYFIIDEGEMWEKTLEILIKKAALGVDVRVMYDGTCEFALLPHNYPDRLRSKGIKCKMFAPLTPFVSTHYNYRDHRKILVIDGKVAFNGGINIADEYINIKKRFGYWKDAAVMLEGEAAKSFTLMFLQMWAINERNTEFEKYLTGSDIGEKEQSKGFVMPYGDCPLDGDKVGERVYMDMLNRAERYVHIMTPYLILDGVMENALKYAAERGVEITVILPGIPDKKAPYALAKTHYASLIESGVKIYEFTPGFVHAKVFVADDKEAVVGTINLDYRSLYHHFECATYMFKTRCISSIENDFKETLSKCMRVTGESIKGEKLSVKLSGFLLKAIAPLL